MLVPALILICVLLFIGLVVLYLHYTPQSVETVCAAPDTVSETLQVISCECPDLATWHPGRVAHKSTCRKFRELNPNLTYQAFMKDEGFPLTTVDSGEWPPLAN